MCSIGKKILFHSGPVRTTCDVNLTTWPWTSTSSVDSYQKLCTFSCIVYMICTYSVHSTFSNIQRTPTSVFIWKYFGRDRTFKNIFFLVSIQDSIQWYDQLSSTGIIQWLAEDCASPTHWIGSINLSISFFLSLRSEYTDCTLLRGEKCNTFNWVCTDIFM